MYVKEAILDPVVQLCESSGILLKKMWSFPIHILILRPVYTSTVYTLQKTLSTYEYVSSHLWNICRTSKNLLTAPENSVFNSATWSSSIYGNRGYGTRRFISMSLGLGRKLNSVLLKAAILVFSCAAFVISYLALLLTQILVVPIAAMVACLALVGYTSFFVLCNIFRNVHFAVGYLSCKLKNAFEEIKNNIFESILPWKQGNDSSLWSFTGSHSNVSLQDLCVKEIRDSLSVKRYLKSMFSVDFLARIAAYTIAGTVTTEVAVLLLVAVTSSAVLVVILSPFIALVHFTACDETLQKWSSEICGEWGHSAFNVDPSSPYTDSPNCNNCPSYTEVEKMFPENSPKSTVNSSSISSASSPKKLVIS